MKHDVVISILFFTFYCEVNNLKPFLNQIWWIVGFWPYKVQILIFALFVNNSRLRHGKQIKVLFSDSIWDKKYVGICFNTIYTNYKCDLCINFNLEFLEMPRGAIVAFVRIWKNTDSTTIFPSSHPHIPTPTLFHTCPKILFNYVEKVMVFAGANPRWSVRGGCQNW